MATNIQQIGNALAGFSAGVGGRLPEFLAQKQKTERQTILDRDAKAQERRLTLFADAQVGLNLVNQNDFQGALQFARSRLQELGRFPDADPGDTLKVIGLLERAVQGNVNAQNESKTILTRAVTIGGLLPKIASDLDRAKTDKIRAELAAQKSGKGVPKSGEQRAFESKLANLTPEQKTKAIEINLGLAPRAVGSAIQTITETGTASSIGDAEATIAQKKKFAELTGSSRAKLIDSGFGRIVKIDKGIRGIDRAIAALRAGANTGAIERFLPSMKAASVELDQIKNELALDVIGGVTLGAISATELDLVKQVALPTGLDGAELIAHLEARKAAQEKLRGYFQEQINFLDGGGTVAGFLREKEREQGGAPVQVDTTGVQQGSEISNLSDDDLFTF